jgi:hypothetical protein
VSLGAGDLLHAHGADFLALAERDISAYLGNLFETVPLPPGLAPVEFVVDGSRLPAILSDEAYRCDYAKAGSSGDIDLF